MGLNKKHDYLPDVRNATLGLVLIGCFSQIGQVLVIREILAMTHGSEFLFGIIFFAWLAWCALGAALGGTGRLQKLNTVSWLKISLLFNGPILAGQLICMRLWGWDAGLAPGQMIALDRAVFISLGGVAPLAFLSGFQFSLVLRFFPAVFFSRFYRAEAVGAMVGGAAAMVVIGSWIGQPVRLALVSGAIFTLASQLLFKGRKVFCCSITALLLINGLAAPIDFLSEKTRWRQMIPGCALHEVSETKYGRLTVLKSENTPVSVYQNAGLIGTMDEENNINVDRPLAAIMCGQHPAPEKILLIGATLSRLPDRILEHAPEVLSVAELNPRLIDISIKAGLLTPGNPKLKIINMDGRAMVKQSRKNAWDLVLVILPEPDSLAINRYASAEFFMEVKSALAPDGALCLVLPSYGASSIYTGRLMARRTASIKAALDQVFQHSIAAPIFGGLLIASEKKDNLSLDPQILAERISQRPDTVPYLEIEENGHITRAPLAPEQAVVYFESLFDGVLEKKISLFGQGQSQPVLDDYAKSISRTTAGVNLDDRPSAILYGFALSSYVQGTLTNENNKNRPGAIHEFLLAPQLLLLLIILAMVVFPFLLIVRKQSTGPVLGAAAGGVFSMAFFLTMLFYHQNKCGFVYAEVGILSAAFMAGLTSGAFVVEKWQGNRNWILNLIFIFMIFLGFLGPVLSKCQFFHPLFIITFLIFLAGAANGASFPLLAGLMSPDENSSGSRLYTADLIGASIAGLLTTSILIPLFGAAVTLRLAAVLLLPAILAINWKMFRRRSW